MVSETSEQSGSTHSPWVQVWPWLLGCLPWIWIIPFNQFFWDDWYTDSLRGFQDQIMRWDGGAKHYLNPLVYFLLLHLGPWAFHVLMVFGTVIGACSLSVVVSSTKLFSATTSKWAGPLFLAMPVFHSRFSAAVIEYLLAMAAFLAAWALLVRSRKRRHWWASLFLLIYAIGVPSLAVLFPLAWMQINLLDETQGRTAMVKVCGVRGIHFLLIPPAYFVLFQFVLNSAGRYQVSPGAILEFGRALITLGLIFSVILSIVFLRKRTSFRPWVRVSVFALSVHLGFFPYFAVGYNPLADFLPWRMRDEILTEAPQQLSMTLLGLLLFGIALQNIAARFAGVRAKIVTLPMVFCATLGAVTIVLGPMDWESRHWLISWPLLTVLVLALVELPRTSGSEPIPRVVFAILLLSSLIVSSEYLIDSLKQKAIVRAVEAELRGRVPTASDSDNRLIFVLQTTAASQQLNARHRGLRIYEWQGLIAKGLAVNMRDIEVLEFDELPKQDSKACEIPFRATIIEPSVTSSRLEAIVEFRIGVQLNSEQFPLCHPVGNVG